MNNGWPRAAFRPDPQNGSGAVPGPTTPRWSAERRRPGCTGRATSRKRGVAPHQRDSKGKYASRRSAGPLISGSELLLTPRTWARARRGAGKRSGDAVEIKRDGRTNPGAEDAPRERDRLRGQTTQRAV